MQLRGYKIGQYTSTYTSSIEGEERYRLGEKWTATLFAGVACLYGDGKNCSDRANLYGAAGKDGNYGVYLKMGYAY